MALQQFGGSRGFHAHPLHYAPDGHRIELGWHAASGPVAKSAQALLDPALPSRAHGLDAEVLQLGD